MSLTVTPTEPTRDLRHLYLARFVFAAAWAAAFAAAGSSLGAISAALLIAYPAFDVAAAVFDARSSRDAALRLNVGVSAVAAIGLAVAATDDVPAVLRVWGSWAIVAGLVQLVVALRRRAWGGQAPMILSGALSVVAGAAFVGQAGDATSMRMLAGYAALGGVFFLVSAIRLGRDQAPTVLATR